MAIDFSVQQRRAINALLRRPPNYTKSNLAENFLLKYVFCEALCRQVCKYYRERPSVKNKKTTKSHEVIQLDVVSRSFAYFGILIRNERLLQLLDSSLEKRGWKSARNLRNGIVHRWDKMDVAEVSQRYSSLCLTLDTVVNAIELRSDNSSR